MRGELEKKGTLGRWTKVWCSFTPESQHLGVYANSTSNKAKTKNVVTAVFDVPERSGKKLRANRFDLEARNGSIHAFSATSAEDKKAWIDAINSALGRSVVQDHPRFIKEKFIKKKEGTLAQERSWLAEYVDAKINRQACQEDNSDRGIALEDRSTRKIAAIDRKRFIDPDNVMLKEALDSTELFLLLSYGDSKKLLSILNSTKRTEPTAAARLVNDSILEKWPGHLSPPYHYPPHIPPSLLTHTLL
jgi:hypothetical protein